MKTLVRLPSGLMTLETEITTRPFTVIYSLNNSFKIRDFNNMKNHRLRILNQSTYEMQTAIQAQKIHSGSTDCATFI